jgi:hypothetical protein
MRRNHPGPGRLRLPAGLFPAALAAFVALAAITPAAAGPDDDAKGWIGAVDLALTQPTGLEQEYAFQSNSLATPVQGTRHLLDNKSDSTFKITGGYGFGAGLGKLEVSYWSFDHGDSDSEVMQGFVFPTLFGYGYFSYSAAYLNDPAGTRTFAESSVNARTVDVEYSRAADVGENFTFRWLMGLRTANFQEEVDFTGSAAGNGGVTYVVKQRRHMDSDARGFKVGGRGTYGFTRRFSLEGGIALSLMQADIKGDSGQTITTTSTVSEHSRGEDSSGQGQILDLDLKGIWIEGPISIYMGYSASSWQGLVRDPNPPRSPFYPILPGGGRDSVTFNSFNVGVIYRFNSARTSAP